MSNFTLKSNNTKRWCGRIRYRKTRESKVDIEKVGEQKTKLKEDKVYHEVQEVAYGHRY